MKVIAHRLEEEVYNEPGHTVTIDMRKIEERQNQSPVEILRSSLSACGAIDIVLILKKRRNPLSL